jgi:hypothetical protein
MKGVDYSKQMGRERANMQEAVVKNRQASDKRVDDLEKRNEFVQDKQAQNFVEDRADLEKTHQSSLENIKDKTQAALDAKNEDYHKRMEKQRVDFSKDRETTRKDFDRRLTDIKTDYEKAHKSEAETNADVQATNKTRYSKNINDLKSANDQSIAKYQQKMQGSGADVKEQNVRQREQLVRSHEDHVNDVRRGEMEKQNDLKEKVGRDLKLTKDVSKAEKEQLKDYTDSKLKRLQEFHNNRSENIARDYTTKNDMLAETQHKDAIRSNRENQDKVIDIKRGFDKKLRDIELDKRRKDNGSGEFADVNKKQMGLKDEDMLNNKIDSLKTTLKDKTKAYEVKTNSDNKAFSETLKTEKSEATMRKDRAVNDLNADKLVTVAKEREKSTKALDNREYVNRLDRKSFETQLMHQQKMTNERIGNLQENFHKAMTTMEERTKLSIDDVTVTSNKDKAGFVKDLNEKRSKELFELKRDFGQSMDKTIQNYEQRLATANRENDLLKMTMNQKVGNIIDQTEKQLEAERAINDGRRKSEQQDSQIAIDQREHKLRTEMNTVIVNYQRKLDKMQVDNDTKMKLITNNYENRLKELNTLKSKELSQKDTTHQMEIQRTMGAAEDEKGRIISAYENKIAGIKAGHEERMLQLDEFKKLS